MLKFLGSLKNKTHKQTQAKLKFLGSLKHTQAKLKFLGSLKHTLTHTHLGVLCSNDKYFQRAQIEDQTHLSPTFGPYMSLIPC
jgi:hypothetical protein